MKSFFGFTTTKGALLSTLFIITSCASVGNESADISECSKIAYGKHNDSLTTAADSIYSQCKAKKDALRAKTNKEETVFIWLEFFFDLFVDDN